MKVVYSHFLAIATAVAIAEAFLPTCGKVNTPLTVTRVADVDSSSESQEEQDTPTEMLFPKDISRRDALAGSATLLLTPLLKELLPEMGMLQGSSSMLTEHAIKGDLIVRGLWLGRLAYPVLVVSLEIGLFEALKDGPLSRDKLGERLTPRLEGQGRVLEALVAVLSSLDLVQAEEESRVALTESARQTLLKSSPFFWGPQLLAADGITSTLRLAVHRDGRAKPKDYSTHSSAAVDSFIESMQAHGSVTAAATALALQPILGKQGTSPATHVLDMAGGSGCFAAALSSELGVKVTLADIPPVVTRFRQQNVGMPGGPRVDSVSADLFDAETWPVGPDCHLLANVLHDWGEKQVYQILKASCAALKRFQQGTDGKLVVVEQLLEDDRSGPLPAALASVSMLLGDWRTGKQYSYAELKHLLLAAGFDRVELGPKCGEFHHAVIAHA